MNKLLRYQPPVFLKAFAWIAGYALLIAMSAEFGPALFVAAVLGGFVAAWYVFTFVFFFFWHLIKYLTTGDAMHEVLPPGLEDWTIEGREEKKKTAKKMCVICKRPTRCRTTYSLAIKGFVHVHRE